MHPLACPGTLYGQPMEETMTKRVALYLRVSTDEQTLENQRRELEAVAARNGWRVVATYEDNGISGSKGRDKRPGYDALCTGVTRREFDMVAAWSVCRLGRSLTHLVTFLGELQAKGVDLYLHVQGLDTSTPSGRAMFAMLGVFSEFERAMVSERTKAGMARARKAGKHIGRPKEVSPLKARLILADRKAGQSYRKVAKRYGVSDTTVVRLERMAREEARA